MAHTQTITLPPLPAHLLDEQPHERTQLIQIRESLFAECRPATHIELLTFERYAWALFLADRFRRFEADSQSDFMDQPNEPNLFRRMDRLSQLALQQERRADRALNELRRLQQDRLHATELQNEMATLDKQTQVPVSLPLAAMRRQHAAFPLAFHWLSAQPDIQQKFANLNAGGSTATPSSACADSSAPHPDSVPPATHSNPSPPKS